MPYRYGTADVVLRWVGLGAPANTLTFTYNLNYQHEFPLYWENISADSKKRVPTQTAHDIALAYSIRGRYNFSIECNNLTNETSTTTTPYRSPAAPSMPRQGSSSENNNNKK